MFANIGDLTSNVISSEKNLPLKADFSGHTVFEKITNISQLKFL